MTDLASQDVAKTRLADIRSWIGRSAEAQTLLDEYKEIYTTVDYNAMNMTKRYGELIQMIKDDNLRLHSFKYLVAVEQIHSQQIDELVKR